MRIPDEIIEEVRLHSDVVDVVGDYVQLRRRGSNHFGLCPFHNEKTASFSVNPERGIYKCFGCGKGGDVFSFIMELEGLGYPEAIRLLAERAGIEIPEGDAADREAQNEIESIYHALRFAARFYYVQLTRHEPGKSRALAYFLDRGFTPPTIKSFGLGYAPGGWDALLKAAEAKQIKPEYLHKAGLVLTRNEGDGHYDRFRDRAIFPLFSHVGKVVGFAGRILDSDSDQPKYINSPETRVYHKSKVLYGLFQAKQAIRKREDAILVEGYTDVISLHQAGVKNVVASSGTALTTDQVRALKRYAKTIVLMYDADSAGAAAAERGIDLVLEEGLSAQVVSLPQGADPDSFVRQFGGDSFRKYLEENQEDFIRFKVGVARRAGRTATPEGRLAVVRDVLRSIAVIANPIVQQGYLQEAADVLQVPENELRRELKPLIRNREAHHRREEVRRETPAPVGPDQRPFYAGDEVGPPPEPPPREPLPEEKILIRLMLDHGVPLAELILSYMSLEEFTVGAARDTVEAILEMYHAGKVRSDELEAGQRGPAVQRLVTEVLIDREEISDNWAKRLDMEVSGKHDDPEKIAVNAMKLLKLDRVGEAIEAQRREIFERQQAGEDPELQLRVLMDLHELRKVLEKGSFFDGTQAFGVS